MNETYIQFKKQRDLGEIITDTFKFLRENYKLLTKLIFKIAGPVFLVLVLVLSFYSYIAGDTLWNPFESTDYEDSFGWFVPVLFLLMLSMLAFFSLLYAVVLNFIRSYIEHKGVVDEKEVHQGVKKDFWSLLGLFLIVGILVMLGIFLCVLPGIYLWVPFSLAPAVLVLGRQSVGDSIGETFALVRDNWWMTFLSLLVISILVYVISMVFQLPLYIYYFFKALTMAQEGSLADPESLFDWVYVVFNVLSSLVQYLLSAVTAIAVAFIYYHLNEKKNFTGSMETISRLGSSETE